ncbi:alpha-ketoacid dehydrogenase subunit alpha/beta [Flaviflexus huanghaiensis]|uniref:alpha-ketoacid dehydrogenase subunit alpha/beta n=1 Tax=Flaviflexus huanghaiensis TaxID=1111473 RepID=UPI0015F9F847|nr:alpha-ketoacid dehydrogenase subunit alpha/beta [Flaviflexus huanghaiensis]
MPKTTKLKTLVPWVEIESTPADWDKVPEQDLINMLSQIHLIRAFEESVLDMAGQKLINGPAHSSIGQEGGAVASALMLRVDDQINGSHRGHHQFLAKAFNAVAEEGIDLREELSDELNDVLYRTLSEIAGLKAGYCKGRGGSMHLQWKEIGAMGTNAIVGGAVPFATGFAFSSKMLGTDAVSVTYFGDGATNIGSTLEAMNLAAAWDLPTCFFIENNLYAVSTTAEEATGESRLSGRGPGFGIASWRVDGMDPVAVHIAMKEAVEYMRAGNGPTVIEALTYRYFHQNGPIPGSAFGYRTKDEEKEWQDRDPITKIEAHMIRRGLATEDSVKEYRKRAKAIMAETIAKVLEDDPDGKPGSKRIRPELWPDPAFLDVGLRDDTDAVKLEECQEITDVPESELVETKFLDAVASVMHRRMEQDDRIYIMGEDVHKLNGGSRGATKGLPEAFPGKVLGTPISEAGFTGLGGGVALDGRLYPVVELMYADFIWVAADQIFNQIGKARHMFGGQHPMSMLLRIKIGTRTGYGSQHSMDPAGILATNPGWRIIAPSTPYDYIGLLNAAMKLGDPVAVLEHDADLYRSVGMAPADRDFTLPVGKAVLRRTGDEVTVISYLSMVAQSIEAVEKTGVDADVIDLRWLDRASIDWDTIGESVKKTNRILIVEQANEGTSYGGWLADEIQRRYFDWLDAPIMRVHGSESSPSISKVLEAAALADVDDVADALVALRDS